MVMTRRIAAAALAFWAFAYQAAWSYGPGDSSKQLRAYISRSLNSTTEVQFRTAQADLNGDGRNEVVVYVTTPEYCGSGGCPALVLERLDGGYRTLMSAT